MYLLMSRTEDLAVDLASCAIQFHDIAHFVSLTTQTNPDDIKSLNFFVKYTNDWPDVRYTHGNGREVAVQHMHTAPPSPHTHAHKQWVVCASQHFGREDFLLQQEILIRNIPDFTSLSFYQFICEQVETYTGSNNPGGIYEWYFLQGVKGRLGMGHMPSLRHKIHPASWLSDSLLID